MDAIIIPATERSPDVAFDFANGRLKLKGESYPEDVAAFYGPLMTALESWLSAQSAAEIRFDIELVYFNSSSAKVLMNMLMLLEKAGTRNHITVNWYFSTDDDTMQEFGEDFAEDLQQVSFNLCAIEGV